jgi:hypothetical protein
MDDENEEYEDIIDDLLDSETQDEYDKKLEALNKLRRDYGPPEQYPKYKGWQEALYCSN